MKDFLTPEKIKIDFITGDLNRDKATELLISILENSDDTTIRVNSINVLESLGIQSEKLFEILENHIISDEDANLRASAAEHIIINYLEEGIDPLGWIIQRDKSPLVLKVFFKHVRKFDDEKFELISRELASWSKKFTSVLEIVPEEAIFFLDIEAMFAKDKKNYEINLKSFKYFKNLSNVKGGEPWLIIKHRHVEVLDFTYFNWKFIKENREIINSLLKLNDLNIYLKTLSRYTISKDNQEIPASIGNLTHLKKLILKRNHLRNLPTSIKNLKFLEELDLSCNKLTTIPQELSSLKSLELLNLKHNNIQNIPESFRKFSNSLTDFRI